MIAYQDAERLVNDMFFPLTYDPSSKLDVGRVVEERMVSDNKAKDPEYYNQRPGTVHASKITGCLRGLVIEMLGGKPDAEPDARKLGVFKAGNLFEDFILDALGDRVVARQRQYEIAHNGITMVGRSDGIVIDDGKHRVLEAKSVHSDSFWYRDKEGTLVAWHNQVQLQIYMWAERKMFGNEYDGVFSYVSKDDVTVKGTPVRFNPRVIDEIVIPILDALAAAYAAKDPTLVPLPPPVVYVETKHQFQKNWIATYCEYHDQCAGKGWLMEAEAEVKRRNAEAKKSLGAMR